MCSWRVERRKRTRHLIELGGLVIKSAIVDLTGDDRIMIFGPLLWCTDKLKSEQGEAARKLWATKGSKRSTWTPRRTYAQIVDARQWHVSLQCAALRRLHFLSQRLCLCGKRPCTVAVHSMQ
jgi:hypothetical protein